MLQDFAEILFNGDASPETEYLHSLVWSELGAALAELPAEQRNVFEKRNLTEPLKTFGINRFDNNFYM